MPERALLGKRVRVKLDHTDQVIVEGQFLAIGQGGDFEILEDDGFVHYCWPLLAIEEIPDPIGASFDPQNVEDQGQ